MEKQAAGKNDAGGEYERVQGGDLDNDSDGEDVNGLGVVETIDEVRGKSGEARVKEVKSVPVPNYDERAEGSRNVSPLGSEGEVVGIGGDVEVSDEDDDELRRRR